MTSTPDAMSTLVFFTTIGYALLCAVSPMGACRRCKGFGFRLTQTRRGHLRRGRDCRRCQGYGRRVRIGRRLFNVLGRLHREHSDAR